MLSLNRRQVWHAVTLRVHPDYHQQIVDQCRATYPDHLRNILVVPCLDNADNESHALLNRLNDMRPYLYPSFLKKTTTTHICMAKSAHSLYIHHRTILVHHASPSLLLCLAAVPLLPEPTSMLAVLWATLVRCSAAVPQPYRARTRRNIAGSHPRPQYYAGVRVATLCAVSARALMVEVAYSHS
jgi:hypothetical protein